jgi:hypothetical protein
VAYPNPPHPQQPVYPSAPYPSAGPGYPQGYAAAHVPYGYPAPAPMVAVSACSIAALIIGIITLLGGFLLISPRS